MTEVSFAGHRRRGLASPVVVLLLALAGTACAPGAGTQGRDTLGQLRQRAAAAPADAELHSELALSEMYAAQGEPAHVPAQLERALALDADNPRLRLSAAIFEDAHGEPEKAFEHYLAALRAAARSHDPVAGQLAEVTVQALAGTEGAVAGYASRVSHVGWQLLREDRLPAPARHALGELLVELAYRRGDRAEAQTLAQTLGCVTEFRAAGPFGPRDLLGFDRRHPAKPGEPLAERYDLGYERGVRATRELGARGCSVSLGGGAVARGGTTYAQGFVEIAAEGEYLVRLESPNSLELFVDGRSVKRLDRRRRPWPGVVYLPLRLAKGRHELTLKLTTRHPNPVAALALRPLRERDGAAVGLPFADDTQSGFGLYLNAAVQLSRGDVIGARQTLRGVTHATQASPLLLLQRAAVFLNDGLYPSDVREDEARRLLAKALSRDPGLWHPAVQLATMAADNGRTKEAIAALRQAFSRWPRVPAVGLTLVQYLRDQEWDHEADAVIAKLRAQVPDACAPLQAELQALRARDREPQAHAVAEQIMRCEAQANARYGTLLRMRRYEDAQHELERLAALEPPQNRYAWMLARLSLAKNRGDDQAVTRHLAELTRRYPQSASAALEAVDFAAGAGDQARALETLQDALAAEPAAMAELHRVAPLLGGEHAIAPYRRDGAEALARFEASGRSYEGPQVLVFDYMAVRVFDDGSSVEVVHTIQKAQSDEAVDELAEVQLPEGARVLTLRTIKPDGRRLEADAIAGKDTVSLPDVKPGDYVEAEYLRYHDPSQGFPGGYLGDRFYFQSFEVPFDYSHLVLALPKQMPYQIDPRGPAPELVERVEDDVRVLEFKVEQSVPLAPEPGSVSSKEYLPSVRVGVDAGWSAFVEGVVDVLADRDLYDPQIALLVDSIVGDAAGTRQRAERLYSWVLKNIENSNDSFSQAAVMLRAKSGNRARVLHYLLTMAGVRSQLALVRSATADATPSDMADGETFEHLLVSFLEQGERRWLFTVDRWAPFGYLPPALAGQPALLLDTSAAHARLPEARPGAELRRLVYDVHLSADGSARIDAVETVRGSGAVSWRENLEAIPEAQLEHRFEEEYVARLVPGATLASLEIEGREHHKRELTLRYSFDVEVLGRRVAGGWALPSMLAMKLAPNYARTSSRTTELLLASPLQTDVVLRIHLPPGARAAAPSPVTLQAPGGERASFELASRTEEGVLIIERKVRLPLMRVPPEQYPAFASFCRKVDDVEAKELVVTLPSAAGR